ncbi:30613_t:CDS:2 [Gigaspora margarita]|uniref:30613_t:CDS:1 n=1 Tax=Gigaspora margarita TaxID=4874 RepID=A0ABN7VQ56_GIGMA|nr:30613_t:CDS:2 [Gigaspora margarita]
MSLNPNKYPEDNPFSVKQNNTYYLQTRYKIPDNYLIQTSWGRGKSKHIIECEIKYKLDGPIFIVRFQKDSQQYILESKESPKKERERKPRSSSFRPFNTLSESMKTKRSRAFSVQLDKAFKNKVPNFFNSVDRPVLQEIRFCVQDKDYLANYNKEKTSSFDAFIKVIDQDARKNINEEINKQVPINILNAENISFTTTNEIPYINNQEIEEEILKYIEKAGYRRITNILLFIIPGLVKQNILNMNNPIIHVRLSDMDQLKDEFFNNSTSTLPPGHTKPPLLPMIPLNHYVPDELHIMLRICDRLWELVIQELKSENKYNTHTRAIISMEIKRISVGFYFWPDHSMQSWSYIPLMGGDKEKRLPFTLQAYE